MIPSLHSGNKLTRVAFDRSPGEFSVAPPIAKLSFGEQHTELVQYTPKCLAELPLTLQRRVIEDAESIWADKNLSRQVARSAGAHRADLEEWSPTSIEWRLFFLCNDCEGNGCAACEGRGEVFATRLHHTDIDGREIDPQEAR